MGKRKLKERISRLEADVARSERESARWRSNFEASNATVARLFKERDDAERIAQIVPYHPQHTTLKLHRASFVRCVAYRQ